MNRVASKPKSGRNVIPGALLVSASLLSSAAHAGDLVYAVNIQTGVSEIMIGTITTDGALGEVAASDILSWSFKATGPTPYAIASSDAGAHLSFTGAAVLSSAVITQGLPSLYLTLDTNLGPGSISFVDGAASSSSALVFTDASSPPATIAFFPGGVATPFYLADNIRSPFSFGISSGVPVPVPEAGTGALFLAGLASLGLVTWRRSRLTAACA